MSSFSLGERVRLSPVDESTAGVETGNEGSVARATIEGWDTSKDYGFVILKKQGRAFLHATAIEPRPKFGSDLNGVEIVVLDTEKSTRGSKVVSALTLEEYDRREAEKERREFMALPASLYFMDHTEYMVLAV